MATAAHLREQIDAALANKNPARQAPRLALTPRLVSPGNETGYTTLDQLLHGGIPIAGTTEILGSRSSGRTTLAMAYLAERTREGHVCAWVDVAGDLSPEAALANGTDLARVLWIRCAGTSESLPTPNLPRLNASHESAPLQLVANAFPEAKPNLRPYNPTRKATVGTPGAYNRHLVQAPRTVQIATDRLPSRRGSLVLHKSPPPLLRSTEVKEPAIACASSSFIKPKKPWSRLEQAIKAVDLLVQAGGFGAIVLDLGSIPPQFARRIPLATWFRWRSALERARTSLIVLTQYTPESQSSCSGSAAELLLRLEPELPPLGTVLNALTYRMQTARRRFDDSARKPPARAQSATTFQTQTIWSAS